MAVSVQAQVAVEEVFHKAYPLEPGGEVAMVASPAAGGPAALGDGSIVFKFDVSDVDPIADDTSDVTITCILIQNLGTAVVADITQVMILDQDGNSVVAPAAPAAPGAGPAGGCAGFAATAPNAQIQFENFFDLSGLTGGGFVIPDDGSETFQVAVRTNTTALLTDNSQNHTLMLQAILQLNETVGSPPAVTTFVSPTLMDSMPDVIFNGGINKFTEDTYVVNPIMPGDEGVVSRFTVCDYDSNEHQLTLDKFSIKEGEKGTAISSDITALSLYRVEGFTRTLVASRVPDATFDRGSGVAGGLMLPGAGTTGIVIPDDKCMTFELMAKVSPFATKMHTIKPRIQISAAEPLATLIDPTVDPEIEASVGTMIGKGALILPDTRLIGKPGIIPVTVQGVQLPGLGTIQIGPTGKLQYDPRVINIKSIRGVAPYIVDATEIDNRLGEARFTVRIDPNFDLDGDGFPDDSRLAGAQDGTVANIFVEPTGKPGEDTRLVLTFDCFELVGQMNCVPTGFPNVNVPNQNPNNDITVSAGIVTLLFSGDVDFDGQPTIADALKVANALLSCSDGDFTTTTTSSDNGFASSPERVNWTNDRNLDILSTTLGNNLVKNAGGAAWNAGASSVQALSFGDGFVETTVSETDTDRMFGLSRGDTDQNFSDIDFAMFLRANGTLEVRRGGQVLVPDTTQNYSSGDVLRVETINGDVRFKKNGSTFLTLNNVITDSSYPLRADTSLFTDGATLIDVVVGSLSNSNNNSTTQAIVSQLTDEQLSAADVAAPFADSDEIPDCSTLTSRDVAEIARLAINFGTSPAPSAVAASVAAPQAADKPWYSFLSDMWGWLTGVSQNEGALVSVDFNADVQTLDVVVGDLYGTALGGIQGRLLFDPATVQVNGVRGLNGYVLLASNVDNLLGEVRFVAIAPKGQAISGEGVVQLSVDTQAAFNPALSVRALLDQDAVALPFSLKQERAFSAQPVPLQLNSVRALSAENGAYRFRAQGVGIAGIQVQVYDLAGGKLFDQEAAGNTLVFQPLTASGHPLANGVYLYLITAKGFQGETIRSNINKLAILR